MSLTFPKSTDASFGIWTRAGVVVVIESAVGAGV